MTASESIRPVRPVEDRGARAEESQGEHGDADGSEQKDEDTLDQELAAEEDGEEGRPARGLPAPAKVSKLEREEHERTHTPYRAWCKCCVMGRGKSTPQMRTDEDDEEEKRKVPRVSIDYFSMSDADQKASENPLIVMLDEDTGEKYARAVSQKGLGQNTEMARLIKDMSNELKSWGHPGCEGNALILKSDGEASIVAVREALGRYHGRRIIPEAPAKGEKVQQSGGRGRQEGEGVHKGPEGADGRQGEVEAGAGRCSGAMDGEMGGDDRIKVHGGEGP